MAIGKITRPNGILPYLQGTLSVARIGARGQGHSNLVSEADLERANRRVADAMRRIADLQAHIDSLERDGHDAADAIQLLGIFETTLELMIDYRDKLAKTLRG